MKQRIAVLALFSFVFSTAAAPLAWGAQPLWPKEALLASSAEPAAASTPHRETPTVVQVIEEPAGEEVIPEEAVPEEAVPPPAEAPPPAEEPPAFPNATQAGEDDGNSVFAGFLEGSRGKWVALGAGLLAIVVIAVSGGDGGDSTTAHQAP